jgi:hypothetical protein
MSEHDDDHHEEGLETFAIDEFDPLPSELHARVTHSLPYLRQVHVEYRNEKNRWLSTRQKITWKNEPKQSPEEITTFLVEQSKKHADAHGYESYRAVLSLYDPVRKEVKRTRIQLNAAITSMGDIEITDDPNEDFSQREHLDLLTRVIERQETQNTELMQEVRHLHADMRETVDSLTTALVSQSQQHAAGIAAIGNNLGAVINASTTTLRSAAELHNAKNQETTVVQLAKMEQEGKKQQVAFAMQLLNKIGGPLVSQLSSLFADTKKPKKKKKKLPPKKEDAETEEPEETEEEEEPELSEEDVTVPREELPARLKAWRAKLSDDQRTTLLAVVGQEHYEALDAANDQASTEKALGALMAEFKRLQEEGAVEELATKLMTLNDTLGEDLGGEFGRLINTMDAL